LEAQVVLLLLQPEVAPFEAVWEKEAHWRVEDL
jgi:hypothetical protein